MNRFPETGTHLSRYASRFNAVEINSSFYRPHRPATYARWAASVPDSFQFSVKLPRSITHERLLHDSAQHLDRFIAEATQSGSKLGPILVQLPPSSSFSLKVVEPFFESIRKRFEGLVVCEPRHPSWFQAEAERVLKDYQVARVAADPAIVPLAAEPGGWDRLIYYRLHGSPRVYHSAYSAEQLDSLAKQLMQRAETATVWCIFDNTAEGAAISNAFDLQARV